MEVTHDQETCTGNLHKKLAPNRTADQSNRIILVMCVAARFWYNFLECLSPPLETCTSDMFSCATFFLYKLKRTQLYFVKVRTRTCIKIWDDLFCACISFLHKFLAFTSGV